MTDRERELQDEVEALRRTVAVLMDAQEADRRPVESSTFAVFKENAELQRVIAAKTASLERSKAVLRSILDTLESEVCIFGPDELVIETNRAWKRANRDGGGSLRALCGAGWAGDDGRRLQTAVEAVLGGDASSLSLELREAGADGRFLHAVIGPTPDAHERRAVLSFTDVTERVRALREAASERSFLSTVMSTLPHGVYWKDPEGRYLGHNESFAALLEERDEELVGRTDAEVRSPSASVRTTGDLQTVRAGRPSEDEETWNRRSGGALSMLVSRVPMVDDGGEVTGMLGVAVNVTPLKLLQAQVATTSRLEAIGQLAAGVAHEINTPTQYASHNIVFVKEVWEDFSRVLGVLVARHREEGRDEQLDAELERLGFDGLKEETTEALDHALEGLKQTASIVLALREFSHPAVDPVETDLRRVLENTARVTHSEWRYVADLEIRSRGEVPAVSCVPGDIGRVLLNMIMNASHAIAERQLADPTKGSIDIELRPVRDGAAVRVTISDDGCGVPDALRRRIFDHFFTTKEVGRGTGQGLSIAYDIVVRRHGGRLWLDEQIDDRTVFHLELPVESKTFVLGGSSPLAGAP